MQKLLLTALAFAFANNTQAQFIVNPATPQQMVSAITAGGISVSNISFTGASASTGEFTCTGSCNLGIAGGIILSSGTATNMALTPSSIFASNDMSTPGDFDLDLLIMPNQTFDASVLEFDFCAISDSAMFNFRFGSEEYNEWVNTNFNDVFAFYISGPGITGFQNIALVPGTTTPVAINNVNNGNSSGIATGPCNNCAYYLDNVSGTYVTSYDGITTTLTAIAANLQPGQTYHLKLAVADVSDHIYDTGVMIEAGSFFSPNPAWLFAGGTKISSNTIHICQGSSVTLAAPAGFQYQWSTGSTTQAISVSTAGNYMVMITGSNPNFPVMSLPVSVVVDPLPLSTPVISQSNDTLYSNITALGYTYSWTLNGLPIVGANFTSLHITQNGCYTLTVQTMGGCFASSTDFCVTTLSTNQSYLNTAVSVFPNPFSNTCTLSFNNPLNENFMLAITDISGRIIQQNEISNSVNVIERKNILSGLYFYSLFNKNGGKVFSGKMMVD